MISCHSGDGIAGLLGRGLEWEDSVCLGESHRAAADQNVLDGYSKDRKKTEDAFREGG